MLCILALNAKAQADTSAAKLKFNGDFRFRVEQDWNSRNSDGSYREDRSRLRYRLRAGATYKDKWYEVGLRLRTGNPKKQQDPQLTLGDGSKEFGTLPIGLEKAYFQGQWKNWTFWLGKNTFPFLKSNELFWSDNVFPEGVAIKTAISTNSDLISDLNMVGGHFIIATNNQSFDKDAFMQGLQVSAAFWDKKLLLYPSFYNFKNIPNIPDGSDTFLLDYAIAHVGMHISPFDTLPLWAEVDYYQNLTDYSSIEDIPNAFKDETTGYVVALKYGHLRKKSDWAFSATYAYLQRYAAVDFLTQNDWARWDYSAFDSPDGRLTNLNGVELAATRNMSDNISLTVKYYLVEQLKPLGTALENGNRIRFDIDIRI